MKALNQREEGLRELTVLRNRAKEDRRMLNEEKKVCVCLCVCVCVCVCVCMCVCVCV